MGAAGSQQLRNALLTACCLFLSEDYGAEAELRSIRRIIGRGRGNRGPPLRRAVVNVFKLLAATPRHFQRLTGFSVRQFVLLTLEVMPAIRRARSVRQDQQPDPERVGRRRRLSVANQVLVVLLWLRQGFTVATLSALWRVSESAICECILHGVPAMVETLSYEVQFPTPDEQDQLAAGSEFGHIGSVDATPIRISRPVRNQHLYYRPDRGYHFLNCQFFVDRFGFIRSVDAGLTGHRNDGFLYSISEIARLIEPPYVALADLAYRGQARVRQPYSRRDARRYEALRLFNRELSSQRMGVEHRFSDLKAFRILAARWRSRDRFFLSICVLLCAQFVNRLRRDRILGEM
jgi:hypothetical protein